MELLPGGGFRLHPMSFDPDKTTKRAAVAMLDKLKSVVEVLERELEG